MTLFNLDPVATPGSKPHRVGAPNHLQGSGNTMVAPEHGELAILAADVVLFAYDRAAQLCVLLIERGRDPFAGRWALPGGRVDPGEMFEQAARRELAEETGITAPARLVEVGVYAAPGRDPRGRVVSMAYAGFVPRMVTPTAGDDATASGWMPVDDLDPDVLAFDHADIVRAAVQVVA